MVRNEWFSTTFCIFFGRSLNHQRLKVMYVWTSSPPPSDWDSRSRTRHWWWKNVPPAAGDPSFGDCWGYPLNGQHFMASNSMLSWYDLVCKNVYLIDIYHLHGESSILAAYLVPHPALYNGMTRWWRNPTFTDQLFFWQWKVPRMIHETLSSLQSWRETCPQPFKSKWPKKCKKSCFKSKVVTIVLVHSHQKKEFYHKRPVRKSWRTHPLLSPQSRHPLSCPFHAPAILQCSPAVTFYWKTRPQNKWGMFFLLGGLDIFFFLGGHGGAFWWRCA